MGKDDVFWDLANEGFQEAICYIAMAIEHKFLDVNVDRKRIAHLLYRLASEKSVVAMYSSGLNLCYGSGVK